MSIIGKVGSSDENFVTKGNVHREAYIDATRALPTELIMRENNIIEGIIGREAKLWQSRRCSSPFRRVNVPCRINH